MLSSQANDAPTPFWAYVHWQSATAGLRSAVHSTTAGAHPARGVKLNSGSGRANTVMVAFVVVPHAPGIVYVTVCCPTPAEAGENCPLLAPTHAPQVALHAPPGSSAVATTGASLAQAVGDKLKLLLVFAVTVKVPAPEDGQAPAIVYVRSQVPTPAVTVLNRPPGVQHPAHSAVHVPPAVVEMRLTSPVPSHKLKSSMLASGTAPISTVTCVVCPHGFCEV